MSETNMAAQRATDNTVRWVVPATFVRAGISPQAHAVLAGEL